MACARGLKGCARVPRLFLRFIDKRPRRKHTEEERRGGKGEGSEIRMMLDLIGPFIFGLAGSGHCLGMCGPLVLAYSLHLRAAGIFGPLGLWPASAAHHAAFHAGRLFTYGLLGAAAAWIAGGSAFPHLFAALRSTASPGGGSLMVVFGACLLGVVPSAARGLPAATGPLRAEVFPPPLLVEASGRRNFRWDLPPDAFPACSHWP